MSIHLQEHSRPNQVYLLSDDTAWITLLAPDNQP